jgi:Holliday junction DNA helicase RuvA
VIGRLRGVIADRFSDGSCILDVGGVGYEVFVPLGSLGRLPAAPEAVTLHVHTHVREDALVLYGFASPEDRTAFRTLLGVSSIGPKLALAILGAMDARQLASAIASQDPKRFKGIPGVGKKIVERLLLELRDALGLAAGAAPASLTGLAARTSGVGSGAGGVGAGAVGPGGDPLGQLVSALVSMGFKPIEAERAVAAIGPSAEGKTMETLLREALAQLS